MCRYSMSTYKPHYACFNCRKTFKRRLLTDLNPIIAATVSKPSKCPECGELMADMGLDFKAPAKSDKKAWEHLANLYKAGVTFHSCGCYGPGFVPKSRQALVDMLEERKTRYIRNRRFWSNQLGKAPGEGLMLSKDIKGEEAYAIPKELIQSVKRRAAVDVPRAVAHWLRKIEQVETQIDELKALGPC